MYAAKLCIRGSNLKRIAFCNLIIFFNPFIFNLILLLTLSLQDSPRLNFHFEEIGQQTVPNENTAQ